MGLGTMRDSSANAIYVTSRRTGTGERGNAKQQMPWLSIVPRSRDPASDIEIPDLSCVFHNEIPPGLHLFAHQFGEDLIGLPGVINLHPEQRPGRRVHR